MRKSSIYLAWCSSVIAASLCFVYPAFTAVRVFWYYPLAHRWEFVARPSGYAVDWYGRTLLALVGGALGFGVMTLFSRRWTPSRRTLRLWTVWFTAAAVLATAVYGYQLAVRKPIPEPIPAWYVPR